VYHRIVKRLAVRNLERVNDHDYDGLLAGCHPEIHHSFGGDHALGGERHDRESVRRWFERLGRLFPDMRLVVTDVWVKGWPHDTTAILRWTNTGTFPGEGGRTYRNHGVHVVRLTWFKAVRIDANEDSQAVVDYLHALAAAGVEEANAAPIVS
jgi:ketosteroid isomerase-like protein